MVDTGVVGNEVQYQSHTPFPEFGMDPVDIIQRTNQRIDIIRANRIAGADDILGLAFRQN
jgi:hypothetical protein